MQEYSSGLSCCLLLRMSFSGFPLFWLVGWLVGGDQNSEVGKKIDKILKSESRKYEDN